MPLLNPGCSSFEELQYWFPVVSNAMFLLIPVYAIKLTRDKGLPFWTLLPEILLPTTTATVSWLYHMCWNAVSCQTYCAVERVKLYKLDFIFAYQMVTLAAAYSVDQRASIFKYAFHIATFIANSVFVNTYQVAGTYDLQWYTVLVGFAIVATIGRFAWLIWKEELAFEMTHHFDWIAGLAALVCAIAATICWWMPSLYPDDYWWIHSLWHSFIALAIFFEFNMYDFTTLNCCRDTVSSLPSDIL